jgi:hypothetical protein
LKSRTVPRFNDRRPLARWGALLVVPAVVLILCVFISGLPTNTEILLTVGAAVVLGVGTALMIGFSAPDPVR